jgi:hypothetical protein
MASAQEILGIRIRARDLREGGQQLLKDYTRRRLTRAQKELEKVTKSHGTYSQRDRGEIGDAYRLFFEHYSGGQGAVRAAFDTSRKALRLAWDLCYHGQSEGITIARSQSHLHTALDAIENQWRWRSFFGVFDTLLRTWDHDKTRGILQEFLSRKLQIRRKPSAASQHRRAPESVLSIRRPHADRHLAASSRSLGYRSLGHASAP